MVELIESMKIRESIGSAHVLIKAQELNCTGNIPMLVCARLGKCVRQLNLRPALRNSEHALMIEKAFRAPAMRYF